MAGPDPGDPSLLRILISTDNHLGVWEKDETRRDDSFRAFEEVLQLAVERRVDFVLLGGDLFHENKPSRATLVKAIGLFSKYCLNDRPVRFRVLSDQAANFVAGQVNFENPNLNVGLPVFTIHGNHDDPAGQDSLSAVDILSQAGLVNYFGKHPLTGSGTPHITLSPVLIQKGGTRLCLYGLGNIRDERLGRAFSTLGCVQWQRPASSPEHPADGWLTALVLHQNRVQHSAFAKACVREEHIPNFVDLAVWGHEHECKPDPVALKGEGDGRYVIQPGSTVATALSEGESRPKHAVLLEVRGTQFRTIKLPLRAVRPFEFEHVALRDVRPELNPEDSEGVSTFLAGKIQEMISRAAATQLPLPPADGRGESAPLLPLIRLRVDYTGYSTVNSQRLGQRFVGKVANPHDMLQWSKAAARKVKGEGEGGAAGGAYEEEDGGFLRPDALDQSRIEDLIRQHLGPGALEVLPDDELGIALHNFVEKDDKNALHQCIEAALEETRQAALASAAAAAAAREGGGADGGGGGGGGGLGGAVLKGDEDLAGAVRAGVARRREQRQHKQQEAAEGDPEGVDLTALTAGVAPTGGTGVYDADEHMTDARVPPGGAGPSQATTATGRGRGRGRGGRQASITDSLGRGAGRGRSGVATTLDAFLSLSVGDRGGTQTQQQAAATPAGRKAAATGGAARGRGRSLRGGRAGAGAASPQDGSDVEMADAHAAHANGEDRIEDLEDEDAEVPAAKAPRRGAGRGAARGGGGAAATPGTAPRARSTRAAAVAGGAKRKSRHVEESEEEEEASSDEDIEDAEEDDNDDSDDDLVDEEEEEAPKPTPSGGRGRGAGARGAAAAAAKAGTGRGRGRAAAAATPGGRSQPRGAGAAAHRGAAEDVITLTSDDDDDLPGPSLGPSAARAHAAAGAAIAGSLGTTQGGVTQTGITPTGATAAAGGATQAAGGGRKRPASFFTSAGGATQGRGAGAGAGRGWGQVR